MKKIETKLDGVYIIEPDVHGDARGYFMEVWSTRNFEELGLHYDFVQDNQSFSAQKGILRGIHFQNNPMAQAKLVRVLRGAVLDFAVDIRKGSPTYGQYVSTLLTADNFRQFYLPTGFAHGFAALENDTVFAYKCSAFYNKASEGCILFNDKDLNIDWQVENPITSEKDLLGEAFADFVSPFEY